MFTYFHDHKNKYNKGQLTPVYILILVIVIIMAMVTVNLSKVAMVKTGTSNSADAGGLAAGAVMANVYNSVAVQNSFMITQYWTSYATIALMFGFAFVKLTMAFISAQGALMAATMAMGLANCYTSCFALVTVRTTYPLLNAAMTSLASVSTTITAIGFAILGASILQYMTYLSIRKMALKGRGSSIRNGHGFVFSNSETGPKLLAGSPPADVTDPEKRKGYRDSYIDFLEGIGDSPFYVYSWKDGRKGAPDRGHEVTSQVSVGSIDEFDITVAVLPSLVETALLAASKGLVVLAKGLLFDTLLDYISAAIYFSTACPLVPCCVNPWTAGACCPPCYKDAEMGRAKLAVGVPINTSALLAMTGAFALLVGALAGLLPGGTQTSTGNAAEDAMYFFCWINDINYETPPGLSGLQLRVDTTQRHEGGDLGLWQTNYPDTASYAVAEFKGGGSIYPPNPNYGTDIVAVDNN